MIDKIAYDELAGRLERELNEGSRIKWYVDRYDARLGDACISDEAAKILGMTPETHFSWAYEQMAIWAEMMIENEGLRVMTYIGRILVEDKLLNHITVFKQLLADQIASKLVETI